MTNTGWIVRLYNEGPDKKEVSVDWIGNWKEFGGRTKDQLYVFQGIYGNGDYLTWYIHKDQLELDFDSFSFMEVRLYLDMNPSLCFFNERYKISDVGNRRGYLFITAYSIDSINLETKLVKHGIKTSIIRPTKPRTAYIKFPELNDDLIPKDEARDPIMVNGKELINRVTNKPVYKVIPIIDLIDDIKRDYNTIDKYKENAFTILEGKLQQLRGTLGDPLGKRGKLFLEIFNIDIEKEKIRVVSDGQISNVNDAIKVLINKFKVDPYTIGEQSLSLRELFTEILEKNKVYTICYHMNDNEEILDNVLAGNYVWNELFCATYINEDMTVRDFINQYCEIFNYEWTVKNNVLHVGKELRAIKEYNSTKMDSLGINNSVGFGKFLKIFDSSRPALVLAHIEEIYRCVWVKHSAGRDGGRTKALFVKIGSGTLSKDLYENTLTHNSLEKSNFFANTLQTPFKITEEQVYPKDEGGSETSEKRDIDDAKESKIRTPLRCLSPYSDHLGGIFFPKPGREDFPDRKLNSYEISDPKVGKLCLGFVPTSHESLETMDIAGKALSPLKGERDFILKLPLTENGNPGPCIYVDGYFGKILLQCENINSRLSDETKTKDLPKFNKEKFTKRFQDSLGNKEVINFFPYPKNVDKNAGAEAGDNDDASDVETEEILTDLNPNGQDETYIYMRPKYTESKGEYNQVSINAGLLKLHLRDDTSQEGGLRIWRYRDSSRSESSKAKFLKTKIEFQMGKTLTSNESLVTINKNSVVITVGGPSGTKMTIDSTGVNVE